MQELSCVPAQSNTLTSCVSPTHSEHIQSSYANATPTSSDCAAETTEDNEGSSPKQNSKRPNSESEFELDISDNSDCHKRLKTDIDEMHDVIKNLDTSRQLEFWEKMIKNHPFNLKQIYSLQDLLSRRLRMDIISAVPYHLASYIMSFLNAEDLCNAAQVCRSWRVICNDGLLWREKCANERLLEDQHTLDVLFRDNIKKVLAEENTRPVKETIMTKSLAMPGPLFRAAYLKHINILRNWRTRNLDHIYQPYPPFAFQPVPHPEDSDLYYDFMPLPPSIRHLSFPNQLYSSTTLQQYNSNNYNGFMKQSKLRLYCHGIKQITCLQYNPINKLVLTCSDDQTITVWDSETGQRLSTLLGHTGGVWTLALTDDEYVISGGTDKTVRIWKAREGISLHTLYGHLTTVRCLAIENETVVSGSRDATMRVWDLKSGHCKHVLVGHFAAIRCVQIRDGIIVSGAYDALVMIWDAATGECLHTLSGHQYRIYCLQFDGKTIVSSDMGVVERDPELCVGSTIRVWDAETGKLRHELKGHKKLVSQIVLKGDLLASSNTDSFCKLWDLKTGRCLKTLGMNDIFNRHTGACTSVAFNERHIITSGDDGTVKLWDTKTGLFIRNLVRVAPAAIYRLQTSYTKLICAVGSSKNKIVGTHLLVFDFDDVK